MTLSGSPVLIQLRDRSLDYDWGAGGPGRGVPTDGFSARWTGQFAFAGGRHDLHRHRRRRRPTLYLDGQLVIDSWIDQAATTYTATRTLTAGTHQVKVEYYEKRGRRGRKTAGQLGARPRWHARPASTRRSYFANTTLSGSPALDPLRDHARQRLGNGRAWLPASPATASPRAGPGTSTSPLGTRPSPSPPTTASACTSTASSSIDAWIDQSATTYTATRTLTAGTHEVKVEYYENTGQAWRG